MHRIDPLSLDLYLAQKNSSIVFRQTFSSTANQRDFLRNIVQTVAKTGAAQWLNWLKYNHIELKTKLKFETKLVDIYLVDFALLLLALEKVKLCLAVYLTTRKYDSHSLKRCWNIVGRNTWNLERKDYYFQYSKNSSFKKIWKMKPDITSSLLIGLGETVCFWKAIQWNFLCYYP